MSWESLWECLGAVWKHRLWFWGGTAAHILGLVEKKRPREDGDETTELGGDLRGVLWRPVLGRRETDENSA